MNHSWDYSKQKQVKRKDKNVNETINRKWKQKQTEWNTLQNNIKHLLTMDVLNFSNYQLVIWQLKPHYLIYQVDSIPLSILKRYLTRHHCWVFPIRLYDLDMWCWAALLFPIVTTDFELFVDCQNQYKLFGAKTYISIKWSYNYICTFYCLLTSGASNQHCRSTNDQDTCILKAFSLLVWHSTANRSNMGKS